MIYFPDFGRLIKQLLWGVAITVPLAAWKAIEVIIWIFKHTNISFS